MSLQKFDDGGHTLVQVSSVMKRVVVWWAKYSRAKGGKTNHRLRRFLLVCLMRIIAFKPSMKKINYSFDKVNIQLIMKNNYIYIIVFLISSVCLLIYFLFQLYLKTPNNENCSSQKCQKLKFAQKNPKKSQF